MWGSVASPPTKVRHRSRRGVATWPARRWIGATCWGRPRRRLPAPQNCHRQGGHRWPRTTRMLARARDQQLAPPERTSGRPALAWRPAGRAPPSHREPRPAKPTPRGGRRRDRLQSANFSMVPTTPTRTPCRGAGRGRGRQTRHRRRVCRRRQIPAPPPAPVVITYLGRWSPGCSRIPRHWRGPRVNPGRRRSEDQPSSSWGSAAPPSRRRIEVGQPPSWLAPSVQPPSGACRAARRRSPGCAPRCKFSSSEPPSRTL
jgi:hypothetical protein